MKQLRLQGEGFATVDDEVFEEVNHLRWFVSAGRVVTKSGNFLIQLADIVLGIKEGSVVVHRSGDNRDYRKGNLVVVPAGQKVTLVTKKGANQSANVSHDKHRNRWRARVCTSGMNIHVGWFLTEEEATNAVNAKKKELGL